MIWNNKTNQATTPRRTLNKFTRDDDKVGCRKQHLEATVHGFHSSTHIVVYATHERSGRLHKGPRRGGAGSINRTSICIAVSLLGCSKAVSVDCYLFVSCFNQYIAHSVSSILVPFFAVGIVFCPVSGRLAFNLSLQTQKSQSIIV